MKTDARTKALADKYGLATADTIATPPPKPVVPIAVRRPIRWTLPRRMTFNAMAPAAIALVATDGPLSLTLYEPGGAVKRRVGHNRAVWPAKAVSTKARSDTVTLAYARNPVVRPAAQWRLWCWTTAQRDYLAEAVIEHLEKSARADGGLDELADDFLDLGPDLDLAQLELQCHALAKRMGLRAWDDAGLEAFLDAIYAEGSRLAAAHRNRVSEKTLEKLIAQALGGN